MSDNDDVESPIEDDEFDENRINDSQVKTSKFKQMQQTPSLKMRTHRPFELHQVPVH